MNRGRLALWAAAVAACVLTAGGASAQEPFPHPELDGSLAASSGDAGPFVSPEQARRRGRSSWTSLVARDAKAFQRVDRRGWTCLSLTSAGGFRTSSRGRSRAENCRPCAACGRT